MAEKPRYLLAYTIALIVCGVLSLLSAFVHQLVIEGSSGPEQQVTILRAIQAVEVAVAITAIGAAVVRVLRVPWASKATLFASSLLAILVPVGTAVFLWWVLSVRRREPILTVG